MPPLDDIVFAIFALVWLGPHPIVDLENTATESVRKSVIKWLSCAAK
jgi:hypothetical protein